MRPRGSLFHLRMEGWLSGSLTGQCDISEAKGDRRSSSDLGWTERGSVECVHVYVGRGKVGQAGKVREENGNEHLLSTYCMLDTFSVLFVKSFQ